MAITINRGNLGQNMPTAGVFDTLFLCPVGSDAVCSSLVVCNMDTSVSKFSIKNPLSGEASNNKQYLFFDVSLEPNESLTMVLGVCLAEGDSLESYSDTGNVTFNLYGQLNTQSGS